MPEKQKILNIFLVIIGTSLIFTGTMNFFFLYDILRLYNKQLLTLSPSMKFYDEWKDTPVHILNRIYLFNFTNPDDFERNGIKPIMKELGPYTYKEYQKKINITWNSNGTVTYRVHRIWYFDSESSNGTANDYFTFLSPAPMYAAYYVRNGGYITQKMMSMLLTASGEKVKITEKVDNFLFKGFDYPLSILSPYFERSMKKLGVFHTFNDSSLRDGVLNIDTGASDVQKVAKVEYWNYSPYQLPGGLITGTTGELFPSELKKTKIALFTPWLCKDLHFDYDIEDWVDGIRGFKFFMSERNIDNGSKYEENGISWPEENFPSGVINMSACYYNAPGIGSYPHFYMADPYYANQVEGMVPDPKKHQSYIIVEPISGVILKASLRVQVNYLIRRNKNFRLYQNIPRITIYPLLWLEKSFELPKSIFDFLKTYLCFIRVLEITALPCLIIGICVLSAIEIWNFGVKCKSQDFYRCKVICRTKKERRLAPNFTTSTKEDKYYFTSLPQN